MEASQAPAQKRRRVEEEVDYIRDTDVWLSDGNVVIVAEDKDDAPLKTYAFKCHRSVLARHSPVFDTLFTLPQPSEAGEEYDGAPVVRLPDPYKVLKSVLKMLYDPHGVPAPDREMKRWESKLSEIAGPLHLTAKYDLDGLHSRLSDVLEAFWPTYLHDWTQRSQTLVDWRLPVLGELTTLDFYLRPNPWRALELALSTGIPRVLPAAYYDLHIYFSERPWSWEKENDCFTASQIWRFVEGRELLSSSVTYLMTVTLPLEIKRQYEGECTQSQVCQAGKDSLLKMFDSHARRSEMLADPLQGLWIMMEDVRKEVDKTTMCAECGVRARKVLKGFRIYLWLELPFYFQVEKRKKGFNYGYERFM